MFDWKIDVKYKYGKVTDCQVVPLHLGHTTFHNVISMDLKNFKYPKLSNKRTNAMDKNTQFSCGMHFLC